VRTHLEHLEGQGAVMSVGDLWALRRSDG
jgi:hypothetical protein